MTNTGKVLIIGLLVVDLGVAAYLLFPKDERAPAVTGTVTSSAITAAAGGSRASETHVVAGSVVPATPPVGGTDTRAVVTPRSPTTSVAPAAPAPAVAALAPDAGRTVTHAANGAQPANRAVASVEVEPSAHAMSKPVMQAERVNGRKHVESHRSGSNDVAAALTAQLVKESAKPDPSLPLPPNSDYGLGNGGGSTGKGTNPVASAMTDQLVRESSKVTQSSSSQ